jgi:hypothetical protein
MEVTALPPSFDLWKKNEFLAHFYSREYEMKLESGKEPHPLKDPIYRPKQNAK